MSESALTDVAPTLAETVTTTGPGRPARKASLVRLKESMKGASSSMPKTKLVRNVGKAIIGLDFKLNLRPAHAV
jgi:hypothetical protein